MSWNLMQATITPTMDHARLCNGYSLAPLKDPCCIVQESLQTVNLHSITVCHKKKEEGTQEYLQHKDGTPAYI